MDFVKELEKALNKKQAILDELEPLRKEEEKLMAEFVPLDEKLRTLRQKIADIEKDNKLLEITKEENGLRKALSGKNYRIELEAGKFAVTME